MKEKIIIPVTLSLNIDIPLSGTFKYKKKTYICRAVDNLSCDNCAFHYKDSLCGIMECTPTRRLDKTPVIFMEYTDEKGGTK